MRDTNKLRIHFFSFFETLFYNKYCFLYQGDQKIFWWRICRRRAVNFKIHLCSSGVNSDLAECFFWGLCKPVMASTDPKRCLLFWKCLQWSCLKAVSVPAFVIGGLQGSTATSGSCYDKLTNVEINLIPLKLPAVPASLCINVHVLFLSTKQAKSKFWR